MLIKITYGKNINSRLNILLTALGEVLGCYSNEKGRNWSRNLLLRNGIYAIKPVLKVWKWNKFILFNKG